MAGLTTFMTMAYIVFVNLFTVILHRRYRPARRRLPRASLELFTKFPVALVPGLGINAIVAFRSSPARRLRAFTTRKRGVEASEQREAWR